MNAARIAAVLTVMALAGCKPRVRQNCPREELVCRREGTVPIRRTVCRCVKPTDAGAPRSDGGPG